MGEMSDYYDDSIELAEESIKLHGGKDLRIFVITYPNGNLHSTTADMDIAYSIADRIDGIVGELTNVHKPLKETDIPEPLRTVLIEAIENPASRVRRDRTEHWKARNTKRT